jgi:hypothetical protein
MSYKKKKTIKKIINEKQQLNIYDPMYKGLIKEINDFNNRMKNLPPNTWIDMRLL